MREGDQGHLDDQGVLRDLVNESELRGVLRQLSLISPQEHDNLSLVQCHMLQVLNKLGPLDKPIYLVREQSEQS